MVRFVWARRVLTAQNGVLRPGRRAGDDSKGYQRQWRAFDSWCAAHVSKEEAGWMAGGTCCKWYNFDGPALLAAGPPQVGLGHVVALYYMYCSSTLYRNR